MHTLKVTLKQHTPLIHFQHDQEGATLRASEVKPKLDKFILTKLGEKPTDEQKNKGQEKWEEYKTNFNKNKEDKDKEKREFGDLDTYKKGFFIAKALDWLVGKGEHPALDYKMRIEAEGGCFKKQLKIINAKREAVIYEKNLLKINAGEYMAKLLMEYISPFFVVHNFGYRQSKGYGSFTVEELSLDGKISEVQNDITRDLKDFYFDKLAVLKNFNECGNFSKFSFDLKKYCNIPKEDKDKLERYGTLTLKEPLNFVFEENIGVQMSELKEEIEKIIEKSNIATEKKSKYKDTLLKKELKQIENDVRYNFYEVLFSKFIDQNYQKYKQGTREDKRNTVRYDKAGIWHYFNELKHTGNVVYWEKRAIKQKISSLSGCSLHNYSLKNDHKNQTYNELYRKDNEGQQYHYIRAILGLAETFEFQTNDKSVKFVVNISNCDTDKVERMQSAIFFKVIDNNIYMCLQHPKRVQGINCKCFDLTLDIVKEERTDRGKRKRKQNRFPINLGRIKTPNFDVDSLYRNILDFYKKNNYVIE